MVVEPPCPPDSEQAPPAAEAATDAKEAAAAIGHVGRYTLQSVLGEGGLGTVYGAWDPLLSRAVAVKTLHRGASLSQDSTMRILHEARAAARLSHPHIVTVFDAGTSERGVYIAMEPLQGQDLRQALRDGWRPTPTEAAGLVRKVADALEYAHNKGVIHCDIKPANIFLVSRKHPKVLDFGIARLSHGSRMAVDMPVTGSPFYLAPEQLRGEHIDRRCDVYALGVVLFEMLTAQRPFVGDSMEAISQAVLNAPTPQARSIDSKVPPNLSALIAKAMARNPADRPESARQFSQALRRWLESSEADAVRRKQLSPRRWAMLGGASLLAALSTAWLQNHWSHAEESPAANSPSLQPPPTAMSSGPDAQTPALTPPQAPAVRPSRPPLWQHRSKQTPAQQSLKRRSWLLLPLPLPLRQRQRHANRPRCRRQTSAARSPAPKSWKSPSRPQRWAPFASRSAPGVRLRSMAAPSGRHRP
ncbi:serine/threonine-protein kinase [Ideonella paludis]|uniref:serine/threonine-protein kinase n=1 Tax=Ideonella paludis TaxID=1233411 RepID=UPI00363D9FBE